MKKIHVKNNFLVFLGTFLLLFILHGLSAIPLSYVVSFLAKSPAAGFARLIILNILAGCIAPIAVFILRAIGDGPGGEHGLVVASDIVRYIFSFIPSFSLARSLISLVQLQNRNNLCVTNVDEATLTQICTLVTETPAYIFLNPSVRNYVQCCDAQFVPENIACCGNFPDVIK